MSLGICALWSGSRSFTLHDSVRGPRVLLGYGVDLLGLLGLCQPHEARCVMGILFVSRWGRCRIQNIGRRPTLPIAYLDMRRAK